MKITISISAYNQGEYLEDCIESCYNQTTPAHEILIVNDGSTDDTREIAERYMFKQFPAIESPVRVINQTNKGLASARNTGLMNMTGDYIIFLDSDDMLEENALEVITTAIITSNADILCPSFQEFGKSNNKVILQQFSLEELKIANRLPYFCCYRKSVLLEIGGYNPKMKWGWEDYDLHFEVLKRDKYSMGIIQDILVKYRVKERSMIHEANEHSDELWSQIRKNHPTVFK